MNNSVMESLNSFKVVAVLTGSLKDQGNYSLEILDPPAFLEEPSKKIGFPWELEKGVKSAITPRRHWILTVKSTDLARYTIIDTGLEVISFKKETVPGRLWASEYAVGRMSMEKIFELAHQGLRCRHVKEVLKFCSKLVLRDNIQGKEYNRYGWSRWLNDGEIIDNHFTKETLAEWLSEDVRIEQLLLSWGEQP